MLPEWLTLGTGAVGSLVAAKWIWRGAAIASFLKVIAAVLAVGAVLSAVGIVSVSIDGSLAVEAASSAWGVLSGVLRGILA